MTERTRKWLVIDASIAGATGSGAAAVNSPQERCRLCLRAVQAHHYGIFFYPQTWEEWRRHRSAYSRQWLQEMYSRRRVIIKGEEEVSEIVLSARLQRLIGKQVGHDVLSAAVCAIMLKDCHLLEASLAADQSVISLDDKVRFHFMAATQTISEIRYIAWANPDKPEEDVVAWLEAGADPEKRRLLGFKTTSEEN